MSVFDLKKGESGIIEKILLSGAQGTRLTALGVVKGKTVTVLAFSLFKSSVLIGCGTCRLAMRKSLAEKILLKGAENAGS